MDVLRTYVAAIAAVCVAMLLLGSQVVRAETEADFLDLSLEELMGSTVSTASKFPQRAFDAPAAITIITEEEIDAYGYRNLGDVLGSVRGMYTTYDRNYEYLGVRGFGRTSNFNNRFLLLIDGYRVNDSYYENAAIGNDLFLDVNLIDRVEIVRGPGSSIYGSNAFFGVINVITKQGRQFSGLEAAAEIGSRSTTRGRLTFGRQLDERVEFYASYTGYRSDGHDGFQFNELSFLIPEKQFGTVVGLDEESSDSFQAKLNIGAFEITGAYVDRDKEVPTASFGSVINQPNDTTDTKWMLGVGFDHEFGNDIQISAKSYLSEYEFERVSFYDRINEDLPPFTENVDRSRAEWWGTDVKLLATPGKHHLVTGFEYQDSFTQDHANFDIAPAEQILGSSRTRDIWAVYLQDEYRLSSHLLVIAGIRHDDYSNFGSTTNPRAGLIITPSETTAVKLLYGTAFRAPSEYELQGGVDRIPNLSLDPEDISTYEFVVEHYLRPNFRVTGSVYRNKLDNLLELEDDEEADMLVFRNSGGAKTTGAEVEIEHLWQGGARLRASYAWQRSKDDRTGQDPANSPRHEIKINAIAPILNRSVTLGAEVMYTSKRDTVLTGTEDDDFPGFFFDDADSYLLTNLTLASKRMAGLQFSASIYNLFDAEITDPAGKEHDQNVIEQEGRTYRLELNYHTGR